MEGFALIVAGGSGTRMNASVPKQFLELKGKPILIHTLEKFDRSAVINEIFLVLPKEHFQKWENLKKKFPFTKTIHTVEGGKTRFHSVKNGLEAICLEDGIVAIHDAVRPFISNEIIENSFETAKEKGSAITVVELKDSIRKLEGKGSVSVDRTSYRLVQTPQTFRLKLLKKAYTQSFKESFTDDASVFESAGNRVFLSEGSYKNIKITTPEDLILSEGLI